jgi:hypothetical protein
MYAEGPLPQPKERSVSMVSSISSAPATLSVPSTPPKDSDSVVTTRLKNADIALEALLQDSTLIESLTQQSSIYVPATRGKILATLWGLIDANGAKTISKDQLVKAIYAEGGSTQTAEALWAELDPRNTGRVTPGDFATSDYLRDAVDANLKSIQESVETQRKEAQKTGALSNSVLDYFAGGGSGTVLDLFA